MKVIRTREDIREMQLEIPGDLSFQDLECCLDERGVLTCNLEIIAKVLYYNEVKFLIPKEDMPFVVIQAAMLWCLHERENGRELEMSHVGRDMLAMLDQAWELSLQ